MFQGLRVYLLLSYVMVMQSLLIGFSWGIYVLFSDTLSRQVDKKLVSLAHVVAPTLSQVQSKNLQYIEQFNKNNAFLTSNIQSIEWFDQNKHRLGSTAGLTFSFEPQPGLSSQKIAKYGEIRIVTLFVSLDRSRFNQPPLQGYIRINQSLEELQQEKERLLWNLAGGILISLVFVTLSGYWLTEKSVTPVDQSIQQLKQFTADASHELRNPLTAIKASIDVMLNHPERIHPKDVRKVGIIANSVEHMTNLVKDLLFLARSDGEMSVPERQWTKLSLNCLLEDLVEWLETLAQQKEITLTYEAFAQISIMGNQEQLIRLFTNLLQNAINYTPEQGFIMVRLVQHHSSAVITVQDTGIGISSEELSFVFQRFWRANQARKGGTGLGLSIAQAIAHSHQGKIKVSSQVGIGTCFEVSLPIINSKL